MLWEASGFVLVEQDFCRGLSFLLCIGGWLLTDAQLLREFDFQLLYPKAAWKEKQYLGFVIQDMWVRVTARQS